MDPTHNTQDKNNLYACLQHFCSSSGADSGATGIGREFVTTLATTPGFLSPVLTKGFEPVAADCFLS